MSNIDVVMSISYAASGNITTKSDVGDYSYEPGTGKPHAVKSVSNQPEPLPSSLLNTSFNAWGKIETVSLDAGRNEGDRFTDPHYQHSTEQDANLRAYKHFKKHDSDFTFEKWNFEENPIGEFRNNIFYKVNNETEIYELKYLKLGFTPYLFGPTVFVPAVINNIILHQ